MHRRPARLSRAAVIASQGCTLVLFQFIMIKVPFRTSTFLHALYVSPLRGIAIAQFKSGNTYSYKNVSRRAILNILAQPNMSLGFWFNRNLMTSRTQCTQRPITA